MCGDASYGMIMIIIMCVDIYINYYIYISLKLLCSTSKTNTIMYVNYISLTFKTKTTLSGRVYKTVTSWICFASSDKTV